MGVTWDSVVEKAWKDKGEKQEQTMSAETFGRYRTGEKGTASAENQGDIGEIHAGSGEVI